MKKILLACFLAFGIGANAQFNLVQGFNSTVGVGVFGAGAASINSTVFCAAAPSVAQANGNEATGSGGVFQQMKPISQFSNGEKIDISMNFRKGGAGEGKIQLFYAVQENLPTSESWSIFYIGTPVDIATATVTTCATLSARIPSAVIPTDASGAKNYGFGMYYTRTSGAATIYYDDLVVKQDILALPECTTFSNPMAGSVLNGGPNTISWNYASNATAYKLMIGTTAGGSDIFNATVVGNSAAVTLPLSSTLYATVTPTNDIGDAVNCASMIMFTTSNASNYCSAGATSASFEKISRVKFAGIDNPSTATVGYEDFTALTPGVVEREGVYPIAVNISGFDGDTTVVWIDYNQDGAFDDATEKVTLTKAATAVGNITIPSTAKLGNTRMRVKMYYGTTNPGACGTFTYGQVEDYTVTIKEPTMATSNVIKSSVSVYPNPFQDVLKISDVKGVKSISVSDVSGRQVKNLKPSAELNLSDLKTGLYIVTLQMEDGTIQSFKAIKK